MTDSTRNAPNAQYGAAGTVPAPARSPALAPSSGVTLGARIAGGLLLANAAVGVLDRIAVPAGGPPINGVVSVIIDLIIGVSLVQGYPKYRGWAIVRAILGAIFLGGIHVANQDWVTAILQLAVSGSFLLLLVGTPGKVRIAVGCTIFGLYGLLEIVGLLTM